VPRIDPLAVHLIACQEVLAEKTGVLSAIRILDTLTIAPSNNFAHFYAVTTIVSTSGDLDSHVVAVTLNKWDGKEIARAPDQSFKYGYNVDPSAPGGFRLTTEFTLDVTQPGVLGLCLIWVWLDGVVVSKTPITLRR
jgi:hypothetical protein